MMLKNVSDKDKGPDKTAQKNSVKFCVYSKTSFLWMMPYSR